MAKHNIAAYPVEYPFGVKLEKNINSIKSVIKEFLIVAAKDLSNIRNITLICMGSSGAIVATLFYTGIKEIYQNSKITICHVKKNGEEAHASGRVTGLQVSDKVKHLYIWIDDFIESGETVLDSHQAVAEEIHRKTDATSFKFDYVVCSTIKCNVRNIERISKNIVYNYR